MATYRKRGDVWRVEVYVNGRRESATRKTKVEAIAWATQRQAELTGKQLPRNRLRDALDRFGREVSPHRKGARWELMRLAAFAADPIANESLPSITAPILAQWRDRRAAVVAAGTVRREFNLLRAVFRAARVEWHWINTNPCADVRMPSEPPSRKRRISGDEVGQVRAALDIVDGLHAETAKQRTGLAFLFALETAMRAGEITGMRWQDLREKAVTLPRTKNGDLREVPLSPFAREIIAALPRDQDLVFALPAGTRDALFRKAMSKASVQGLHFHDSRAEAIWRLSKKLPVLDLARMIGHRDLKSLMIYYNASADSLADLL
jgi:integrase